MIYIFSSAFYDLFQQNVLNATCYPNGHVMRLRYDAKYIEPAARENPQSIQGKNGVVVFAEGSIANRTAKESGSELRDYRFYPLRHCIITAASAPEDIFIVDVKLGNFLDYRKGADRRDELWDSHIKALRDRPWPKYYRDGIKDEGYYLFTGADLPNTDSRGTAQNSWRSVVDRLNSSELKDCVTYRVLGFYRLTTKEREEPIVPEVDGPDALYRFDSSETVLMKVLFYGDANRDRSTGRKELRLDFDSKAFTSASVSALPINSHYNEERILLPCARTTDPVITTLAIVQSSPTDRVWSPQPVFVVRVAPKHGYLIKVILLFSVSFLLGSLGKFSELWNDVNWTDPGSIGDHLAKPIAGLLFLLASWLYLRKFPLK